MPQIRPLADIVHYKYLFTYLLTYLTWHKQRRRFLGVARGATALLWELWPSCGPPNETGCNVAGLHNSCIYSVHCIAGVKLHHSLNHALCLPKFLVPQMKMWPPHWPPQTAAARNAPGHKVQGLQGHVTVMWGHVVVSTVRRSWGRTDVIPDKSSVFSLLWKTGSDSDARIVSGKLFQAECSSRREGSVADGSSAARTVRGRQYLELALHVGKTTKCCWLLVFEQFLVIQPWLTTAQHGNYRRPATLR